MHTDSLNEIKVYFITFYKLRDYANNFSDNWYPILRF